MTITEERVRKEMIQMESWTQTYLSRVVSFYEAANCFDRYNALHDKAPDWGVFGYFVLDLESYTVPENWWYNKPEFHGVEFLAIFSRYTKSFIYGGRDMYDRLSVYPVIRINKKKICYSNSVNGLHVKLI
jgi:hypothetical protein